jgi:lysozyme family protein
MHFDAAVNHGVSNAARMLQEALAVTVDGEIGPQTLAASRATSASELVARYADIRRARYRSLGHFWRFGRGWLRRVDLTMDAAIRLTLPAKSQSSIDQSTGETDMTTSDTTSTAGKWWAHSLTVWGAIITAASTVLPALGPLLGLDITSDLVQQLGQGVVDVAQAVAGLVGIVMTVYGRSRAASTLERRKVTFQL